MVFQLQKKKKKIEPVAVKPSVPPIYRTGTLAMPISADGGRTRCRFLLDVTELVPMAREGSRR